MSVFSASSAVELMNQAVLRETAGITVAFKFYG
jgi:hypothetical protein